MIGAEVAVFTDALGVERPVVVLTLESLLRPALGVVAVLAHSVGVVVFRGVAAVCDEFSMLLNRFGFVATARRCFLLRSAYFGLFCRVFTSRTFRDDVQRFIGGVPALILS